LKNGCIFYSLRLRISEDEVILYGKPEQNYFPDTVFFINHNVHANCGADAAIQ